MVRQPQETQTLYAELTAQLQALEAARTFASLKGAFTKKRIGKADYWYFKTSETAAGQREYAIGPDSPATRTVMDAYRHGRPGFEEQAAAVTRLCALRTLAQQPSPLTTTRCSCGSTHTWAAIAR